MVCDELLMGRFRVVERLGSGGMGTVYRAYDERLQRHVAVKEVDADPQRVLREAQAAARLNHPGIVTLYELGERDGRAILVSELVRGETLALLHAESMLSDRDVAELGSDLCDALEHAHARGVVHRDIKPQNVVVTTGQPGRRRAKLLDFGIARVAGMPTLTAAGEIVGTLAYMSPEQAEGELAEAPSDIYSLALTLYECWAGTNPAAGRTPAETARRIGTELPSLREHRPDLPVSLTDTIDCCLDPEPDLRPQPWELRDSLRAELMELDPISPVPLPGEGERPQGRGAALARAGMLVGLVALLGALAGPLALPGLALVLAVLSVPALICGIPAAALAQPLSPLLGVVGLGAGAAVTGAPAPGVWSRAALGAGAWFSLLAASVAAGIGPDLGIASQAPGGWESDAGLAAESVLAPLAEPTSLALAAIFAAAAVILGWLLTLRTLAYAVCGALVWAAGVDAALSLVAPAGPAAGPAGPVLAGLCAVAIEFGVLRAAAMPAEGRDDEAPRLAPQPLGRVANPPSGL